MTRRAYCAKHGVTMATLDCWRRIGRKQKPEPDMQNLTTWPSWIHCSFLLCALSACGTAQPKLTITSPKDGTVFHPGQTVKVNVEALPANAFKVIFIVGWSPIGFSEPLFARPYRFDLQLPANVAPGEYQLTANGTTAPDQNTDSKPVTIIVEPSDPPLRLHIEPTILELLPGQKGYLRVVGEFAGNQSLELTKATRVNYSSGDADVASVQSDGIVSALKPGTTKVFVTFMTVKAEVPVTVRAGR